MKIICFIDGSCEPINPGGGMGIGVTVKQDNEPVRNYCRRYEPAPENSSNLAEYLALSFLLEIIKDLKPEFVLINSDSQILINQMSLRWKIKNGRYKDTAKDCLREIIKLQNNKISFKFQWIPRDENILADSLSKL